MAKKIFNEGTFFNSIGAKLNFSFSITTLIIIALTAVFFWFDTKDSKIIELTEQLNQLKIKVEKAYNLEKDFYIEETINPDFYETGKSKFVYQHSKLLLEIREDLKILQKQNELTDADIAHLIDAAVTGIDQFEISFDSLVKLTVQRGFKDYNLEGDMRRAISRVSSSGYHLDEAKVLSIRRREKDYFLRKDETYVQMLLDRVDELQVHVNQTIKNEASKKYVLNSLNQYKEFFLQIVELDKTIGFQKHTGLRKRLEGLSESLTENISTIEKKVTKKAQDLRYQIELIVVSLFIVFIAINFLLSYFTTRSLSDPISGLSQGIREVVESGFEAKPESDYSDRRDEIGRLSNDFKLMLSKMSEHNNQILKQQERLSWAYEDIQLLGKLGKGITSTLIIDEIIEMVQHNLQQLMDATVFWIGVYNPKSRTLDYKGGLLGKEQEAKSFRQNITELDKLGVWCFKNEEEVIINDLEAEGDQYKNFSSATGEQTQSIIYVPLIANAKAFGVFSVQHNEKDFFNEVRINLIRNLASYAIIAIDNALIYQNQEQLIEARTARVREQSEEIATQKEKIEKSFENIQMLSEIGKTLSSYLSVEAIIEKLYEQVNNLMDADLFGLGIYKKESNSLLFPASVEHGKLIEPYQNSLEDTNRFSVWAFTNQQEIFANNLEVDLSKYGFKIINSLASKKGIAQSIIYLPLQSRNKTVGVIGVQSMRQNAYNSNHLHLLRSMAVYAAIALGNANSYEKIKEQRNQVEKASEKVRASINYAKRIQEALLPNAKAIKRAFPKSFVLFKPRDIVSGDFYWFNQKGGITFLAALDCTGHGVPGAFMSMIGNELLNEAVNRVGLKEPNQILRHMHKGVRKDLRQYETDNRDGMDMVICTINKAEKKLKFAGANNPIIYMQDGEMHVIKGDRLPVGGEQRELDRQYTQHVIDISKPTTFYLFSDGYPDQFGGRDGKKFMAKKFRKLLYAIHDRPMDEQKEIMETTLSKWMNGYRQIDDILVMGVKL